MTPGAELPTAHFELIPFYASLIRHLHTRRFQVEYASRQSSTVERRISCIEDIYGPVYSHQRSGFGKGHQPCRRRYIGREGNGLDFSQTVKFLAVEEPLEIQLAYGPADARAMKSISVTMRTPGHDFDLAAGFLMTQSVVRDVNDIDGIVYAAEKTAPIPKETQDRSSALPYQPRKKCRPCGSSA